MANLLFAAVIRAFGGDFAIAAVALRCGGQTGIPAGPPGDHETDSA